MKKIIERNELKQLVLKGITTKDLNDNYDYSGINDMSFLFYNCSPLRKIPELDTKNVTDMNNMFNGCKVLTEIPYLETQKVTTMYSMFSGCESLTTIPELTTDIVTDMEAMFYGCTSLTTIPYLETKNVTDMAFMFSRCKSLSGNLSNWNVGKLQRVEQMFEKITINPTILNWDLPLLKRYNFQEEFEKEQFMELKEAMVRLGDLIAFL